jgi:hypothetical protein
LLEPDVAEQLEHPELLAHCHRLHERLIAVAEVDGAPHWRAFDPAIGPSPVAPLDLGKGAILLVIVGHGQLFFRGGSNALHDSEDAPQWSVVVVNKTLVAGRKLLRGP